MTQLKPRQEAALVTCGEIFHPSQNCLQMSLMVERGIAETQDVETRGTMFQQLMGLADLQLDCYSSQLESLRHQPQQAQRYAQLKKKYEDERRKLIEPLCKLRADEPWVACVPVPHTTQKNV